MDVNAIDWRALLERECAQNPRGKAGAAAKIGYGRAYISRVLSTGSSRYEPKPCFIRRVVDALHVIAACPHTGDAVPRRQCAEIASAAAPTHNPARLALWKSCQRCINNPVKE